MKGKPLHEQVKIVHSDDYVIVVDKPAGLAVHAGAGRSDGTLVDVLLDIFPDLSHLNSDGRPGIVHRLDLDTSGLLMVGRTEDAMASLSRQIRERVADRRYLALVRGVPHPALAVIDGAIGRDPNNRTRQRVITDGRAARTRYRVVESFGGSRPSLSLLELKLETGRMHQIRVHMQAIGHPILGDRTYGDGGAAMGLNRQFLHAFRLKFQHPQSGEWQTYRSDLPAELSLVLDRLRR